jgi:hypothetical protein
VEIVKRALGAFNRRDVDAYDAFTPDFDLAPVDPLANPYSMSAGNPPRALTGRETQRHHLSVQHTW